MVLIVVTDRKIMLQVSDTNLYIRKKVQGIILDFKVTSHP